MNQIGLSKKQIQIDFAMIAAISRKLLDKKTPRYYFVADPVKLEVDKMPKNLKRVEIKLHPNKADVRKVKVSEEVHIAKTDYDSFKGQEIRLMSLCNLKLDKKCTFTGLENKRIQKIQWVSEGAVPVKVRMDTGAWISGLGESALKKLNVDDVVQFERFGFVRLDKKSKEGLEFWFSHR